jgi:hypothetical protein
LVRYPDSVVRVEVVPERVEYGSLYGSFNGNMRQVAACTGRARPEKP